LRRSAKPQAAIGGVVAKTCEFSQVLSKDKMPAAKTRVIPAFIRITLNTVPRGLSCGKQFFHAARAADENFFSPRASSQTQRSPQFARDFGQPTTRFSTQSQSPL